MKKILSMMLMLTLILTMVTGCVRMTGSIVANEDNSINIQTKICYDKKTIDGMKNQDQAILPSNLSEMKIETIDGKKYYVDEESETYSQKKLKKELPLMLVDKSRFYYNMLLEGSVGDMISVKDMISQGVIKYIGMDVTLQSDIKKTNGTLSEDKKTAHWEFNGSKDSKLEWYAYCDGSKYTLKNDRKTVKAAAEKIKIAKDKTAPVIKGVVNGKTYKKSVNAYIKDNVKLKSIKLNNKSVKLTNSRLVKKGKYKNYYKVNVTKKGTNKIIAIDAAGNKKIVTFKIKK